MASFVSGAEVQARKGEPLLRIRGQVDRLIQVVDDLVVHGSPEECREKIQRYVENGVDTPVLAILPLGMDPLEAARALAPR